MEYLRVPGEIENTLGSNIWHCEEWYKRVDRLDLELRNKSVGCPLKEKR